MKMKLSLLLFLLIAVALASCTGNDDRGRTDGVTKLPEPDGELAEIDEPLLIALSQAKNFHRKAKVYLVDGKLDEAIAAVREILAIEFPEGAPEAEDIRLDAHATLAKLLLAAGRPEDAMKAIDDGIAESTRDSFFLANLYTVKGEILEAQAAAETDPQSDKAKALRRAAIAAYDHSIQINDKIQKQLYEDLKGAGE